MAKYSAAYSGLDLLWAYVARNKADDHAAVKPTGINHPLDGHVWWTEIRYSPGHAERVSHVIREKGEKEEKNAEKAVFFVDGNEATLYPPNWRGQERAEISLHYSRDESSRTQAERPLTDYARQAGEME
jgi:hypothetical protein